MGYKELYAFKWFKIAFITLLPVLFRYDFHYLLHICITVIFLFKFYSYLKTVIKP